MIELFKVILITSVIAIFIAYCLPIIVIMVFVEKMNIIDAFRLVFKWFKEDVEVRVREMRKSMRYQEH